MEHNEKITNEEYEYVDHIQSITLNPFFMSRIIHAFVSGYEKAEKEVIPFNLLYIVLPIIYYRPSRKLLIKAQSRSSLRSLFVDDLEKAAALGGLQERLFYFYNLTNQSFIIAANEGRVRLNSDGWIELSKTIDYKDVLNKNVRDFIRAAHYLGLLCSKMEVSNVYRLLGVTLL
ncbi:three component ABC system middle component [uncultured Brevibacillus sp.]|uniref:three component ABC system middle component n=1 Tax=uncultured Brevibacillus sp. TaxID=169970 RepID=UPI0025920F55|nr:three component ABC system middle component [uncultured Brevibacillus sp.]